MKLRHWAKLILKLSAQLSEPNIELKAIRFQADRYFSEDHRRCCFNLEKYPSHKMDDSRCDRLAPFEIDLSENQHQNRQEGEGHQVQVQVQATSCFIDT